MIFHVLKDIDTDIVKTLFVNFFLNASIVGWPKQDEYREKYNCNVPWAILLDPTSACNMHCIGCWAAEYGDRLNLTFEEIDDIIRQGKEMGIYMYIYTGGEPLVRKEDLIRICRKHSDCEFLCFTNGTLIDDRFAEEMFRVKNFIPAISLEASKKPPTAAAAGEPTRRSSGPWISCGIKGCHSASPAVIPAATQILSSRRSSTTK